MTARILLVEDEPAILESLQYVLGRDGFTVVAAKSAAEAQALADGVDLVVLDLMLPDGSGFDLIRGWRAGARPMPIIVLSSRDGEADRVAALESGADDYVTKPFSPREIVARVRAVLRRSAGRSQPGPDAESKAPPLSADPRTRRALAAGRALDLTRVEFDLLATLLASPGRVFTRAELIDRVWGDGFRITDRTIDSHVKALRKKIAEAGADASWIETVRGVGYRLSDDPSFRGAGLSDSQALQRMVVVAAASIGLILFVAFVVSRLLRTRTRGMSIRMQVFLALGVIVGAFAFGLGLMVIDRIEARAVRIAGQAAGDEAASIAGMVAGELDRTGGKLSEVARRFEHERARGADLRLLLVDESGRVIFPAGAPDYSQEGLVHVDHSVVVRGKTIGAVRVVKPTVVMKNLLADMAPTVLVISLVLGAAAAAAAAMIGRAIAEPIERLSAFGERVSRGERTAPPPPEFGREVTRLSRALDSMRRELSGRPFVETFAADLSHELKNPVAAIRASAEVLEESALEEPAQARHFVARIREATERIERLLSELLSLAHIEARGAETFEPIDLARLARRLLETLGDDRPRVSVVSEGDVRVSGDELWLTRALSNLVDNALVHSEPSSKVLVDVTRHGEEVVLTVRNRGSLARHVQERLFRRFITTRPDKGGTGLGLAIVHAVAEAHGGQADVPESGPPEVTFRLRLPAARLRATLAESVA